MVPEDLLKRDRLSLLRKAIFNLSFDMFTFTDNDTLTNIYGSYLVKDPFSPLESLEETEELEMKEKVDMKKLKDYLSKELKQLEEINDLLASFDIESDLKKIVSIKQNFVDKHPYKIKKTVRYIIGKLARSKPSKDKKEVLDLTTELIEKQKSITEKTRLLVDELITEQQQIIDTSGCIEDEHVRFLIKKLEELRDNMIEQEKTNKVNKVKYIELEMDQFILKDTNKDNLEKQRQVLVEKSKKYIDKKG